MNANIPVLSIAPGTTSAELEAVHRLLGEMSAKVKTIEEIAVGFPAALKSAGTAITQGVEAQLRDAEEMIGRVRQARLRVTENAERIVVSLTAAAAPPISTTLRAATVTLLKLRDRATELLERFPAQIAELQQPAVAAEQAVSTASAAVAGYAKTLRSAAQRAAATFGSFEEEVIDGALPKIQEDLAEVLTSVHEAIGDTIDAALGEVLEPAFATLEEAVFEAIDDVAEPILEEFSELVLEKIDDLLEGSTGSAERGAEIEEAGEPLDAAAKPLMPVVDMLFGLL